MVDDHVQQMARSLKNIEKFLAMNGGGAMSGGGGGGTGISEGVRALDPRKYVIRESDNIDGVPAGGAVTIEPGETKTVVEARGGDGLTVLAVGATDEAGVTYQLVIDDQKVVGGTTNSPLGQLTDPFSFIDKMNAVVPADRYVEYRATLDSEATGSVEVAGRMHVEVM